MIQTTRLAGKPATGVHHQEASPRSPIAWVNPGRMPAQQAATAVSSMNLSKYSRGSTSHQPGEDRRHKHHRPRHPEEYSTAVRASAVSADDAHGHQAPSQVSLLPAGAVVPSEGRPIPHTAPASAGPGSGTTIDNNFLPLVAPKSKHGCISGRGKTSADRLPPCARSGSVVNSCNGPGGDQPLTEVRYPDRGRRKAGGGTTEPPADHPNSTPSVFQSWTVLRFSSGDSAGKLAERWPPQPVLRASEQ